MIMQTKPISTPEDVTELEGMRVVYQHFQCFTTLYVGTIEQAKVTAAGVEVYICPDKDENAALLSKWKNLAVDSVIELVTPSGAPGNLAAVYQINRPDIAQV